MLKPIAVFGAGGFGLEVAMLIEQINAVSPQWEIIGFFDDAEAIQSVVNGYPILGSIETLNAWPEPVSVVLGIGHPETRQSIVQKLVNSMIDFPVLIHPSVIVGSSEYVKIGEGCIICAGTIITTNIEIGKQVVLNLACTVGHETKIGAYSTFMPTCNISGEVCIGKANFWGTGAKIINRTRVGDDVIIGAGAVVTRGLPSKVTAVGVPAKIIKQST
jgi:sugar O-acyltransferase (sialic acid O-acetyltransferase NeuD family)